MVFVNLFIVAVVASAISNYSPVNIILKFLLLTLLLGSFILLLKSQGHKASFLFDFYRNVFPVKLIGVLEVFLLLNLTYSENIEYGLFKFFQLNLTAFPFILILVKAISLKDESLFRTFYISTLGWSLLIFIAIVVVNPFDQSSVYKFELTRWSHVILGRFEFLLLAAILGVVISGLFDEYKKYALITIVLLILAISVTGLRSVMLGVFLLVPVMLIIGLKRRSLKIGESVFVLFFLVIAPFAANYFITTDAGKHRIETLIPGNNQLLLKDASVTGRLDAYKTSLEKFSGSPLIGKGLGGFYTSDITGGMHGERYPHNFFMEVLAEAGIAGMLFWGYFIFLILKKTRERSIGLMIFFLAALYLAMFSKDLPGNSVFLLGLAFVRDTRILK